MVQARQVGVGIGALAAAASVIPTAEPASADNWGSTASTDGQAISLGGGTNPLSHSVSFHDVGLMRQATVDALTNVYGSQTQLTVQVNSDNSSADVRVHEDYYGLNGAAGWVNCPGDSVSGSHPTRRCFNQTLKYNDTYALSDLFQSPTTRKYLACHELGHTVGLRHTNSGNHPEPTATCMFTPFVGNYPQSLRQHDVDTVNILH